MSEPAEDGKVVQLVTPTRPANDQADDAPDPLPQPLAGVRVLEFSHTIMGPCAGMVLADLGAEVVKVEPAPDGDHTRRLPGFASGFFACFNRNKRSLVLDLKRTEGQAVAHRLAASADVVLENYGPGTMERLGCGWERLCAANPRLVYLALKGFLAGPYEHRPALDEVVQFQAGLAYMTGPPGRPLARRRLRHRHPGRRVRRGRRPRGAPRARCDRPRPARLLRPLRERRVPDGQPHGRPRRHRRAATAHARAPRRLGHLRRVRHGSRGPDLHRRHERSAVAPLLRRLRARRNGGRPAPHHQCPPRRRARLAHPGPRRSHGGAAARGGRAPLRGGRHLLGAGRQARRPLRRPAPARRRRAAANRHRGHGRRRNRRPAQLCRWNSALDAPAPACRANRRAWASTRPRC